MQKVLIIFLSATLLLLSDILASDLYALYSQKSYSKIIQKNTEQKIILDHFKPSISKFDLLSFHNKIKFLKTEKPSFLFSPKYYSDPINHLSYLDFHKMSKTMKYIESSDKEDIMNQCGFYGHYQFGLAALEDLGYVKKGEYRRMLKMKVSQKTFMQKYVVWADGMSAFEFIQNHQFEAFKRYTIMNYTNLKRNGYLKGNEDIRYVKGLLFSAHLIGVNALKRLLSNKEGHYVDANGISAYIYFHIGYRVA